MEHEKMSPAPGADGQLPEKHEFDGICGACGALVPAGSGACLVCGAGREDTAYQGVFPVPAGEEQRAHYPVFESDAKAHRSPELWRRWGGGLSAALALVLVVIAGFGIYRQYFDTSSYRAAEAVLFESSGGRVMISYPELAQPREITGLTASPASSGEAACVSPNGRWVAYTSGGGELSLIDLAQRNVLDSSTFEAVRLADDAKGTAVFTGENDHLVYLTRSSELVGGDLTGERWSLDTGVERVIAVEGKKVLYARHGDRGGQLDLYITSVEKDAGEWLLIGRNVTEVLDWTGEFDKLLYTALRQDEQSRRETTALQLYESTSGAGSNTTTTIATGVGKVLDASAAQGTVVWFVPQEQEWTLATFVDDDLAARDRRTKEPDLADYPLVQTATRIYGASADFTDLASNEELLLQNERYQKALKDWEDKQKRDLLREELEAHFLRSEIRQEVGLIYVYHAGAVTLLDTDIWGEDILSRENGKISSDKGFAAYRKLDLSTLQRMKMSEHWQSLQVNDLDFMQYFLDNTYQELFYATLSGTHSRLYARGSNSMFQEWSVTQEGDGVYFTVSPLSVSGGKALYYAPVKNGVPGTATLVQRGVFSLESPAKDGVLFLGGQDGGQFFLAHGVEVGLVGDVGAETLKAINADESLLLLCKDLSPAKTGSLYLLGRGQRKVADGVLQFERRKSGAIYILTQESAAGTQDLHLWNEGQKTLVERDVKRILPMQDTKVGTVIF